MDVREANQAVACGATIRAAAEVLAARELARTHGVRTVRMVLIGEA